VGQSCVDSAGYVYCIGGDDANSNPSSAVYYAEASSSGVGNWTVSANPYPKAIEFESCGTASGYVYCVAGTHDANGDDTNASYYATLSPLGVGPWVETTPFPVATDALSCSTTVGDLYCVGGETRRRAPTRPRPSAARSGTRRSHPRASGHGNSPQTIPSDCTPQLQQPWRLRVLRRRGERPARP